MAVNYENHERDLYSFAIERQGMKRLSIKSQAHIVHFGLWRIFSCAILCAAAAFEFSIAWFCNTWRCGVLFKTFSAAVYGIDAELVEVEVDLTQRSGDSQGETY